MPAQRDACVAAAIAVSAERDERDCEEAPDLVGNSLHVIGHRDDRSAVTAQLLVDERDTRLGMGMQPVPALDFERIMAQQLEACGAPHFGGYVVLFQKHGLRSKGGLHRTPAGEDASPVRALAVWRPARVEAAAVC